MRGPHVYDFRHSTRPPKWIPPAGGDSLLPAPFCAGVPSRISARLRVLSIRWSMPTPTGPGASADRGRDPFAEGFYQPLHTGCSRNSRLSGDTLTLEDVRNVHLVLGVLTTALIVRLGRRIGARHGLVWAGLLAGMLTPCTRRCCYSSMTC